MSDSFFSDSLKFMLEFITNTTFPIEPFNLFPVRGICKPMVSVAKLLSKTYCQMISVYVCCFFFLALPAF